MVTDFLSKISYFLYESQSKLNSSRITTSEVIYNDISLAISLRASQHTEGGHKF